MKFINFNIYVHIVYVLRC